MLFFISETMSHLNSKILLSILYLRRANFASLWKPRRENNHHPDYVFGARLAIVANLIIPAGLPSRSGSICHCGVHSKGTNTPQNNSRTNTRISSTVCVFVGAKGRRAVVGTGTGMRQFNQKVERLKAAALDTQIFWSVRPACVCVKRWIFREKERRRFFHLARALFLSLIHLRANFSPCARVTHQRIFVTLSVF